MTAGTQTPTPSSQQADTHPILTRTSPDLPARVEATSGTYFGANWMGERRLRAALPLSRHLQDSWSGIISNTCRLEDLLMLCEVTERLFKVEVDLCAALQNRADELLSLVARALEAPELLTLGSEDGDRIVRAMVDFDVDAPEEFSLEWLVLTSEKILQQLHRRIRVCSTERDKRLAALHRQKFSLAIAQFLSREATRIDQTGLDSPEHYEDQCADALSAQLQACALDPMQTMWPQPDHGQPIQEDWDGLVHNFTQVGSDDTLQTAEIGV